jgi:hypothetical protein
MSYGGQQQAGYGGQQKPAGYGGQQHPAGYGGQQQTASYGGQQVGVVDWSSSSSSSSDSESEEAKRRMAAHRARQEARRRQRLLIAQGKAQAKRDEEARKKAQAEKMKRQQERMARREAKGTAMKAWPWQQGQEFFAQACTGKNLRIMPNNEVNGTGGEGKLAKFSVSKVDGRRIQIKNEAGKILRIEKGLPDGGGKAGHQCWFTPQRKGNKWAFKTFSVGYLGILPNGSAKPANKTGTGAHGVYTIKLLAPPTPWRLNRHFFLQSQASKKNLRIMPNGQVNGTGGDGKLAEFRVSKVDGSKIQLTNEQGKTLRVHGGTPDGGGGGGGLCWFTPKQLSVTTWVFATASGGYLGILPNGSAKPHAQTGTGVHGRFTVRWK